jgi:hypothetical protein
MNKPLDFGEPTFKDLGLAKRMWRIQPDGSYWIDSEKVVAYHNDPRDLPSNMFSKIRERLESVIEDVWTAPWKEMTSSERGAIDKAYVDL